MKLIVTSRMISPPPLSRFLYNNIGIIFKFINPNLPSFNKTTFEMFINNFNV